jgi:hypothetical protein
MTITFAYWALKRKQIALAPEDEREEIRQIFADKGFSGHELDELAKIRNGSVPDRNGICRVCLRRGRPNSN